MRARFKAAGHLLSHLHGKAAQAFAVQKSTFEMPVKACANQPVAPSPKTMS
jgi:hypothetical protein